MTDVQHNYPAVPPEGQEDPFAKWRPMWDWMKDQGAVYSIFLPDDVKAEYLDQVGNEPGAFPDHDNAGRRLTPTFDEAWETLRDSWEWDKGISDAMTEAGDRVLRDMIEQYLMDYRRDE